MSTRSTCSPWRGNWVTVRVADCLVSLQVMDDAFILLRITNSIAVVQIIKTLNFLRPI